MGTTAIVILVILGFTLMAGTAVGMVLAFGAPRGKLDEVQVELEQPFELACVLPDDRPHKLWVRWSAKYEKSLEPGIGFGLTFDIDGKVGDDVVIDHPLGIGGVQPEGVEIVRGPQFWSSTGGGINRGSTTASKVMCELGPRPRGSAVVIRGTANAAPGTYLKKLKLWIGR